jgi:hypothetical protein
LAKKAKGAKLEPGADCPSDIELACYVNGGVSGQLKEHMERHLAECFLCLDKVAACHEGNALLNKRKIKGPPAAMAWKAKNIGRITDEVIKGRIDATLNKADLLPRTKKLLETEKTVINWLPKNLKKNKWLIASITAFALSFAFPPVFLQFLLAAGILGGKWIFDSENARTLIMIYNAWKRGGDKEAGEMIEVLRDRIPNKK